MVKRGGTKTKIAMEKITKKLSIAPTFSKRRKGLFSKASQLCLLSGAHIAILATPPSSKSNVSFYSFGHSSVDSVVSAYLSGQRHVPLLQGNNKHKSREDVGVCLTRKDLGLGLWWEDESLIRSEDPEELRNAMDSMRTLLSDLKGLKTNVVVNNDRSDYYTHHQAFVNDHDEDLKEKIDVVVLDNGTQEPDQTLILQSTTCPAVCCIPDDDSPENYNKITEEQYQINDICESFGVTYYNNTLPQGNMDYSQEMDSELQSTTYAVCCIPDHSAVNFNEINEEEDLNRVICVTDNNNNNNATAQGHLDYDQGADDIEQLIDFNTPFESYLDDLFSKNTFDLQETCASLLTSSEALDDDVFMETTSSIPCSYSKDNGLVLQRCLNEDDLRFSDFFNDTIAAV